MLKWNIGYCYVNDLVPDTPTSLSKQSRDSKESTPVSVNDTKQQHQSSTPPPPLPPPMPQINAELRAFQRDNSQESDKEAIENERRAPIVSCIH